MKKLLLSLAFFSSFALAEDQRIQLDFQNADIETVAQVFAKLQGKNLIVDPRVKGSMNLVIKEKVDQQKAFELFMSAIRLQGFTVVDADGLLKLIPQIDAAAYSKTTESMAVKGQYATVIFKISHEQPSSIANVVRPLISPTGSVTTTAQTLVVTDYADNLKRISSVVQSLDFVANDVDIYQLKNTSAVDLVPTLSKLLSTSAIASPINQAPQGVQSSQSASQPMFNQSQATVQHPQPMLSPSFNGSSSAVSSSEVLADSRTNSVIIRAANSLRLSQIRSLIERLDLAPTSAGQSLHVVKLKHADASKLAPRLTALFTGSMAVKIDFEPSINSLMILATQEQFLTIRAALDDLDQRRPQVFIESMIVEINSDRSEQFGIDWSSSHSWGKFAQSLGAASITNGIKLTTTSSLSVVASALAQTGLGNILSTPTLLTLDNEEAQILVGKNVPFLTGQYANNAQPQAQTGSVVPFQTIERRDVGLMLKVRPQINDLGTVRLFINQEVSSVDSSSVGSALGVTTSKRTISSNVLADDGSTVILGGLLSDQSSTSGSQVPLVGDVPVVGWLFKNQASSSKKSNLVLFVRPVVIRNTADSDSLARQYNLTQK